MLSSARRSEKYGKKVSGDAARSAINRYGDVQRGQFRQAAGRQVKLEKKVKSILEAAGVMPSLNHFYMNFGKKLDKLRRTFPGTTFQLEGCIEYGRWLARSLDAGVLDGIAAIYGLDCVAEPVTDIYDFSAGSGVDKWAWRLYSTGDPPAVEDPGGFPFSASWYDKIKFLDANYFTAFSLSAGTHSIVHCKINIPTDPSNISQLYVQANTSITHGPWHKLYVWNFNTPAWELADQEFGSGIVTLDHTYNANFSDYIQGGYMRLLVLAPFVAPYSELWLDYVKAEVTHT